MATRYWIYKQTADGDSTQISDPFESEAAAEHTAHLLNQEVDNPDIEYRASTPHEDAEPSTVGEVFGERLSVTRRESRRLRRA